MLRNRYPSCQSAEGRQRLLHKNRPDGLCVGSAGVLTGAKTIFTTDHISSPVNLNPACTTFSGRRLNMALMDS